MKIAKVREVKTPVRGTSKSAGIDMFVPSMDYDFIQDYKALNGVAPLQEMEYNQTITIHPRQRVLIPSGIKVNFEGEPKALIGFNKSGVATKQGLDLLAAVVDEDYQGEIAISLVNTSKDIVSVKEGQKLAQFLLVPVFYDEIVEVEEKDIHPKETERGNGGFGSTGNS